MQVGTAEPPTPLVPARDHAQGGPAKHRPRQPLTIPKVLGDIRAERDERPYRGAPAQAALAAAGADAASSAPFAATVAD